MSKANRNRHSRLAKDVRLILSEMITDIQAPLPRNYRMLPDYTLLNLDTNEVIFQQELNRRYLIALLQAFDIAMPQQANEVNS